VCVEGRLAGSCPMIAELVTAFKRALLCNYVCARLSGEKQAGGARERERERESLRPGLKEGRRAALKAPSLLFNSLTDSPGWLYTTVLFYIIWVFGL